MGLRHLLTSDSIATISSVAFTSENTWAMVAHVVADVFGRIGFNVEVAELDLGAVVQRRNSMEPVSRGGWSITAGAPASFGFIAQRCISLCHAGLTPTILGYAD